MQALTQRNTGYNRLCALFDRWENSRPRIFCTKLRWVGELLSEGLNSMHCIENVLVHSMDLKTLFLAEGRHLVYEIGKFAAYHISVYYHYHYEKIAEYLLCNILYIYLMLGAFCGNGGGYTYGILTDNCDYGSHILSFLYQRSGKRNKAFRLFV